MQLSIYTIYALEHGYGCTCMSCIQQSQHDAMTNASIHRGWLNVVMLVYNSMIVSTRLYMYTIA